ncbi:MAG: IPT/TIG domain-containing protein, partial [Betaproteobacteria bacterium]
VRAVVPDVGLPEGAKTTVTVQAGSAPVRTFDFIIGRLPLVLGVKPGGGPAGQLVAIEGRGFDPDRRANQVSFAGQPALVVSAAANELKVIVPTPPSGDLQPELAVVVKTADRVSSSRVFYQLARGATSGFRPRFFPAPVAEYPGEDLAFVSTEIGPVLLLAGRPGGPAAPERALAVSSALNAIVDAAPDKPVTFELRERENAVGVAGDARALLAATPEDVAAYSKPWETGRGAGRRLSASAVARYWTALLQDYLGLFLERRRPIQVLALSPRGRVLSDIYSEASRRAPGERSVPTSIVLPTPASMATALRQMALVVSAEAPRAVVAIEGRWQGSIEDPDHGTQSFQAQLRADSGRLSGTITTRSGSIEVRTPLRELAFERGSVRFTADLQGAPHRFKGALDGNTVTGTVERPGKPALPFTMQYQD